MASIKDLERMCRSQCSCWRHIYGDGKYCDSAACMDCWNKEME